MNGHSTVTKAAAKGGEKRATVLPSPKAPPADPSLVLSELDVETIFSEDYWRKICPHLHVNDPAMHKLLETITIFDPPPSDLEQFKKEVNTNRCESFN